MQRNQLNVISNFALRFFIFLKTSFLICVVFVGVSFFPQQAESKSKVAEKETPTKITSDIIDIKRKSQTVDFLGNVVVEKEDSSLLADKMRVFYEEKKGETAKQSAIKRIDAEKNVKIFSEEFIGTGDFGHYDPANNLFVLEKNVIVNNGVSIASGNKFVYNIKTKKGRFVGIKNEAVIGGDARVQVIIGEDFQDQKPKNKK